MKIDGRTSLESLGLSRNPFGEAVDEFFSDGDRGRQLDELRHLARWSRRLLAVTGERGVGKSTLYRALSNRLDPGVKAARINANLTSDTREVLAGIIHGFGMAVPANADPRLLIELIALHVREQIDANRYCLVLIDDAHLLELRALEQLLKLIDAGAEEGLRIVFFAEAYFVQSLDKASKRSEQGQNWHEIRLSPFTDDEARRYVDFRLAAAGHEGRSPFTPNQLSVIVGGSGGLPGRIDELASAILTGELTINDERRWLPRMHRALALLVLIAAGMGWLIFYNYDSSSGGPTAAKNGAKDAANSTARSSAQAAPEPVVKGDTSSLTLAVPQAGSSNESTAAREPSKTPVSNTSNMAVSAPVALPSEAVASSKSGPSAEDSPGAPSKVDARIGGATKTSAVEPAKANTVAQSAPAKPDAAAVLAEGDVSKADSTKTETAKREAAVSNAVKTDTSKADATKKPTPVVALAPERKPSGTVASTPPAAAVGKPQTAQWLRQQPAKYFTLQLFATTSREKRDAFVNQQEHPDRFATFETMRNGEPWYAVTYGVYATQAEAKSAAASLPASIGKVEPWIRTLASVQSAMQ